jgi:UDP-N-acetylmuramyl pentapeptide phosphotransferase/UDP-N-acetylglucosamine-1-phosphate transferase
MSSLLSASIAAFLAAALLTRRFCNPSSRLYFLDHPNERSLHTHPIPRAGGVAIVAGMAVGALVVCVFTEVPQTFRWLFAGTGLVALVSFIDDRRSISVGTRFAGHVIGAGLLVFGAKLSVPMLHLGLASAVPEWLAVAVALLFLIWMTNLYNFMDGMDGFAGGMAVFGFGSFALSGFMAGHLAFAGISLVIAASAGGFLCFSFPPARIFMGDVGSTTLGLLAGGLSLWGAQNGVFPFWTALLIFSPFIVDATVTLLRRLGRGERVWQAHKSHYYQRLVQSGWGHRKTVLYEYLLMLACGLSALLAQNLNLWGQFALILFWCLVYPLLMISVHHMEQNKKS